MSNDKQLDHLIGVLYETALDPSRWGEAIGLCICYASGVNGHLLIINKKSNTPIASVAAEEIALQIEVDYLNHYHGVVGSHNMTQNTTISDWLLSYHIHDRTFTVHTEFLDNYYNYQGIRYALIAWFDHDDDNILAVVRVVDQQPIDLLSPLRFSEHLQRALRLQQYRQDLHAKVELSTMATNALTLPILIVDCKGIILHLNVAAELLLNRQNSGLNENGGCVYATNPNCKYNFTKMIAEATGPLAKANAMFLDTEKSMPVFVTPLPVSPTAFSRDGQMPLALILISEINKNMSAMQLLGTLYDFSPAELRVAFALLIGKSLEEYAQQAGVTINTVRTQLRNLFNKTNTNRQTELVALLSRASTLHK